MNRVNDIKRKVMKKLIPGLNGIPRAEHHGRYIGLKECINDVLREMNELLMRYTTTNRSDQVPLAAGRRASPKSAFG